MISMETVLRRVRGLLGLGFVGGCVGVLFGPLAVLLNRHPLFGGWMEWGLSTSIVGWGLFGVLAGSGFGLLLTSTSTQRHLHQLNFWWAALLGGAVGLAVPMLFGPQLTWAFPSLLSVVPRTALCGAFGMLLGSGLVAVAKESERQELPRADNPALRLWAPGE